MYIPGLPFVSVKTVSEGMLTFLPGLKNLLNKKTGGTNSARYCYSVWLRHYVKISQALGVQLKGTHIAELGPGDSLGTGIAAMLSGYRKYIAIDSVHHFNTLKNLDVLDDIHRLYTERHPIPDDKEFPLVKPFLEDYSFPSFLFDVSDNLTDENKNALAHALEDIGNPLLQISYLPAASAYSSDYDATLDLIFSQAVLEHVDDLPSVYEMCRNWLRPGGLMSHTIDFKCHGSSNQWNGHWTYPSWLWRILLGRRKYFINRQPLSRHLELLEKYGV
jgi:hypothetical protein